ncbi:MAG: response regulator [Pseudomonadota bacterium]
MSRSSIPAILIVDGSDDNYDATVRALRKDSALKNRLHRCENGREALDYLYKRGRFAPAMDAPRPGIVLLDLNMPGIDSRRVLSMSKSDASFRPIPIIVMKNLVDEHDIAPCYDVGANSYVKKPFAAAALPGI